MPEQLEPDRHPVDVAPELLGWTIACRGAAAVIVEVEAYHQDEPASHAYGGVPTPRTRDLFGPAGSLYVYFTYGMHWCANLVTGAGGSGEAVLLRAAVPIRGLERMRERRSARRRPGAAPPADRELCAGPARLVDALDIRPGDGGCDLLRLPHGACLDDALGRADDAPVLVRDVDAARIAGIELPVVADRIAVGPRIGISKAVELPWRFGVAGSPWLSKPLPAGR